MNRELLLRMVEEKYINVQKHPDADLYIYNYAARAQYDNVWNDATLAARGLILDSDLNIVARPFSKFFNLQEVEDRLPNEPFELFEKLDGSLGILYWLNDKPAIATRGSFISEQAQHATDMLYKRYSDLFIRLDRKSTYLFEIIYPSNRIVVDYRTVDDLFLLARIDNQTGFDLPVYGSTGFPVVKHYDGINSLQQLKAMEEENKEGFVLRFKSGFRVKVKFAEYVKLHRIITGISNVAIWEHLSEGKQLNELLERVPDEFYKWVKQTEKELFLGYDIILNQCKTVFKEYDTRKDTAVYFQQQKYPSVLFSMLDKKSPDKLIWRMLRPDYCKPFKIDEG